MITSYTDTVEEYETIRSGTGLIDYRGVGLLHVTGSAALSYLGEIATRPVDFLLEGQITAALLLNSSGSIVSEVAIHCTGDGYLLEFWPAQAAAGKQLAVTAAEHHDVAVTDISEERAVLAVEGPDSFKIVQDFLPFPVSAMAYQSFTTGNFNGHDVLVSRTGVTGEYGYKIHAPAAQAEDLRAELIARGAREVGFGALGICQMEMRFANLESEIGDAELTPFHVGLQWMVDFGHDFTGKQALLDAWEAGIDARPVCWQAELDTVPAAGERLHLGEDTVGEVVHAVRSPRLDRVIGVARVRPSVAASGLRYELNSTSEVHTVSAPFLVATSFSVPLA